LKRSITVKEIRNPTHVAAARLGVAVRAPSLHMLDAIVWYICSSVLPIVWFGN
jgi:hypothetical protein